VKDDRLYLSHIQEGIARILSYTASGESAFRSDIKTQDAVIRNLQVLGEAVKNVSMETRATHPEVPWKDIAGMRDRVVHAYFGVSMDIVWDIVENHLPALGQRISQVLKTL